MDSRSISRGPVRRRRRSSQGLSEGWFRIFAGVKPAGSAVSPLQKLVGPRHLPREAEDQADQRHDHRQNDGGRHQRRRGDLMPLAGCKHFLVQGEGNDTDGTGPYEHRQEWREDGEQQVGEQQGGAVGGQCFEEDAIHGELLGIQARSRPAKRSISFFGPTELNQTMTF